MSPADFASLRGCWPLCYYPDSLVSIPAAHGCTLTHHTSRATGQSMDALGLSGEPAPSAMTQSCSDAQDTAQALLQAERLACLLAFA